MSTLKMKPTIKHAGKKRGVEMNSLRFGTDDCFVR